MVLKNLLNNNQACRTMNLLTVVIMTTANALVI